MTALSPHRAQEIAAELRARLGSESVVRTEERLSRRTTLRVGGPADVYVEPGSEADLQSVLAIARQAEAPIFALGRGSNLLVRDGGIRGIVVHFGRPEFCRLRLEGDRVHCGAGVRLRDIAFEAKKQGMGGLEFMEGIPGNVGGALRMNAGAMGSSMSEVISRVRFMGRDGAIHERDATDLPFEYRRGPLFEEHFVLAAVLAGTPAPVAEIDRRLRECSQKRWSSQPTAPSAGCIFKNPASIPAGRLIQELGLKGLKQGGAAISEVHGNFMVNDGQAKAADFLALIDRVKREASERGIALHTEVQIVGED
jgi:UDP-N-acetylenolpyruvoylglucosamine reductase